MESRLSVFIAELRRRKVTRVAIVYAVVGFVVWQAAEIAFPALDVPDSALTLVVLLTVLGFPIALVLSWAYELRPEEPRPQAEGLESGASLGRPFGALGAAATGTLGPAPVNGAHGLSGAGSGGPSAAVDYEPVAVGAEGVVEAGSPLSSLQMPRPAGADPRRTMYRVLVVDDDEGTRLAHSTLVRTLGHAAETAADGLEALAKLPLDIDLIMLDADMPNLNGFEVARRVREDPAYLHLPIVMVTGLTSREDRIKAIEVGVNDFIVKPIDAHEFKLRADWLLELKSAYDRLANQQAVLERMVDRKTAALREALEQMTEARRSTHDVHLDTIHRLTLAAEYVDQEAAGHIQRVGLYSEIVAERLGLSPAIVEMIRYAAPMHDVGKIGIPREVLMKGGALNADEWELVRSHTTIGGQILGGSPSPVITMGERIALSHHERWDGGGYPKGLAGEEIPLEGRICAVVDAFDSMTIERPHRSAVPTEEVVKRMRADAGQQFDPRVLDAFFRSLHAIRDVQHEVR